MTSIQLTQKKRVTLTRVSLMQQEIEATWHLCVAARCVRLRSPMTATVLLRTALLPTHPRVRLCHALHSHVHESTDGLHAMRDSLAIDGVGFLDEVGEEPRETACILKPFGGLVHEVVRGGFGVDVRLPLTSTLPRCPRCSLSFPFLPASWR